MGHLFNVILYQPIFNALFYLYDVIPGRDLGVAIIILTLIIKLILFWPSLSGLKAQKRLQDTQPKIEAIKKKYKDDKEELGRQLMKFYQENKINPFSSCLPLLIQLPILIALYRVFLHGLQVDAQTHLLAADQLNYLYGYLKNIFSTQPVEVSFLGIIDLAATKNIYLAVLAGLAQFISAKMFSLKKAELKSKGAQDENMAAMMNKQMLYFMPILTVVFGYQLPAGVTLYWLVTTLFTVGQQFIFLRIKKKNESQLPANQ
jgi:YidC/Oxa1 family membrane protein insertase